MTLDVTLCTVLYEPDWPRTGKIIEDSLRALDECGPSGELLICDNSPVVTPEAQALSAADPRVRILWNDGYNIYLAGALNRAAKDAQGTTFVYFCASHGVMYDSTWLKDLLAPLEDPHVGQTGDVKPCQYNRVAACAADIFDPQVHVQGGVWSARTEVLREVGFGHRFPFEFCDVDFSRRLVIAGYRLVTVASICSVPALTVPNPERFKYVHDYR